MTQKTLEMTYPTGATALVLNFLKADKGKF